MPEHVSREVWAKRVERWSESGLTAGEFAAEVGINPRTLIYWKWRLRKEARGAANTRAAEAKPTTPAVAFVEVAAKPERVTSPEPFELVLDGLVVRVPASFDGAALRLLLEAVRP